MDLNDCYNNFEFDKELVSDDDIIQLNVGGENFNARRDTLCLIKDTLLASMFSGRWEDSLPKLQDGRFFLGFDPECFKQILNRLREMRLTQCCDFPVPEEFLSSQHEKDFFMLAKYLGVLPPNQESPIPFFEPSQYVTFSYGERSQTITLKGTAGYNFLKTPVLKFMGTYPKCWKVQIERLCPWIMIGIISNNDPSSYSQSYPTSYGWTKQNVCLSGEQTTSDGWHGWQVGDEATLKLDPDSRTLQMNHKRALSIRTFQLDVGPTPVAGWRLLLTFSGYGRITVASIHSDEMF